MDPSRAGGEGRTIDPIVKHGRILPAAPTAGQARPQGLRRPRPEPSGSVPSPRPCARMAGSPRRGEHRDLIEEGRAMLRSVEGLYRDGKVELLEMLADQPECA